MDIMDSHSLNILIAEDDILLSIGIEAIVQKLGHEIVAKCSSGEDLIEKAARLKPDLLIVDLLLSDTISGIEAVKIIKTTLPDVSVIYVTADSDPRKELLAKRETGFLEYLVKPIELDKLKKAITAG